MRVGHWSCCIWIASTSLGSRSWSPTPGGCEVTGPRQTDAVQQPRPYDVVAHNIDPMSDNKIHDDDVARQLGFSGALVPGVELFAYLTHPLVEAWGTDFLGRGGIDVRFRRPVYDGDKVTATATPED